jgi:hypothetical protein
MYRIEDYIKDHVNRLGPDKLIQLVDSFKEEGKLTIYGRLSIATIIDTNGRPRGPENSCLTALLRHDDKFSNLFENVINNMKEEHHARQNNHTQ